MPRPIHFEIFADDTGGAIRFYGDVFGWQFHKWDGPMPYWLVRTGDGRGIDGGLGRRVTEAGGRVVAGPMPIAGIGWLAYCTDPEGTTFGIMQADPQAA